MAKKINNKSNFQKILDAIHAPGWLVVILAFTFILRIPSFFEPFSYGDEMIYLTLGNAVRQGLTLYKDVHDNKPPLLYLLAGIAGNVFWFRAILAGWMIITTIAFWRLTEKLFSKNLRIQQMATIVFAILTTIPLLEGQIANAEVFMIGPVIFSFLILLYKKSFFWYFISGLIFSIAILFKVPSFFDIGVVAGWLLLLVIIKKRSIKTITLQFSAFILGVIIPIAYTFIWYYFKGALNEYIVGAYLQNLGYLSSWRPHVEKEPFLVKNAPLIARSIIVALSYIVLLKFNRRVGFAYFFACLWLLTSLFGVTLSERPYPHYLIQSVPPLSLLVGMLIHDKTLTQSLTLIPLTLAFIVPVYFKFWYYPSLPYYSRFVNFALGKISKEEYFSKFDGNVNRNYKISAFIRSTTNENDPVFVWGDSPPIYAMSRRFPPLKYVATYHIKDFSSSEAVMEAITKKPPTIIVLLKESPAFPELQAYVYQNYVEVEVTPEATLWRRIKSKS